MGKPAYSDFLIHGIICLYNSRNDLNSIKETKK